MAYQKMKMMERVGLAHISFDLSAAIYIYSGDKGIVLKCEVEKNEALPRVCQRSSRVRIL